jgi:microcystin-dependent protein
MQSAMTRLSLKKYKENTMSEPFIGEIKLVAYADVPKGWAPCDGRLLAINTNQALFSLLGTTYGGNGVTTFGLPDLRGRTAMHPSASTPLGSLGGVENVTLVQNNLPAHSHTLGATDAVGTSTTYTDNYVAAASNPQSAVNLYGIGTSLQPMSPAVVSTTGGNQPHQNCQPSLVMNYCIALQGVFPSRN